MSNYGSKKSDIVRLLQEGHSYKQIVDQVGCSKASISFHAKKLGIPTAHQCSKRYDWIAIQKYYDEGHSMKECQGYFGFSSHTWSKAILKNKIKVDYGYASHRKNSQFRSMERYRSYIEQWLRGELSGVVDQWCRPHRYIKRWIIEQRGEKCEQCGWNKRHPIGGTIPIHMDHIDGYRKNTTPDNLRLLCPNCHSLTENYGSKNRGKGRPYFTMKREHAH